MRFAEAIQHRLAADGDRYRHVLYRLVPYEPGSPGYQALVNGEGDTVLANDNADARLWPVLVSFLTNPSGPPGTFTVPATPLLNP